MDELPEDVIEEAEQHQPASGHSHEGIGAEDGTLVVHLERSHQLAAEPGLSGAALEGLHDRLHGTTDASDD